MSTQIRTDFSLSEKLFPPSPGTDRNGQGLKIFALPSLAVSPGGAESTFPAILSGNGPARQKQGGKQRTGHGRPPYAPGALFPGASDVTFPI